MNADEIVKTLQAQFDKMRGAYEVMSALAEVRKEEIEFLQAHLAEAQRRERAAVEDIHTVYSDGLCEVCGRLDTCLMMLDRGEDGTVCHGIKFEWRGPVAGEESR